MHARMNVDFSASVGVDWGAAFALVKLSVRSWMIWDERESPGGMPITVAAKSAIAVVGSALV
jgi:hypothetical protein